MTEHPIPPLFNGESKILILGSFPSISSRKAKFFYGHPQNRFWRVMSNILDCAVPVSVAEKREFLLSHGVALWDVIASCNIVGSADSTIKDVTANDINVILSSADIRAIFVNGKTAAKYYGKYIKNTIGRDAVCLPSTSPANAAVSLEALTESWSVILDFLK